MMREFAWVFLFPPLLAAQSSAVERHFAEVRKSPPELYAFLLRMPKGADLHNHLTGAVYAENYLHSAAEDGLCVDLKTFALVPPPCGENSIDAARAETNATLAEQVIDNLSMRNFVAGRETGHDHFFATFGKFGGNRPNRRGELFAEVIRRAAAQNESYLELMSINGNPVNALGTQAGFDGNFESTKDKLMANGLAVAVKQMSATIDELDASTRVALGCDAKPESAPCRLAVRHMYQVLREAPKEHIFAQILAGLMLASSDSRVAGINFVQPEDGPTSMRDYHLQMQMLEYGKRLYPNVHVSLHAGELAPGMVPPDGLRFHIREAVELGHAERIGHGVSVMYEDDAEGLLALMKQRNVLVEINLTSNDQILGIRGRDHPFATYRKYGVPVALSTDDEGVARSHLTEEYQRAVLTYGLTYGDLKEIVRNSLEFSFLPGASYWRNHAYQKPNAVCVGRTQNRACRAFLEVNDKARYQWELEQRFAAFERTLSGKRP